jgi:tetratricopeptide (TPR) repeat protein
MEALLEKLYVFIVASTLLLIATCAGCSDSIQLKKSSTDAEIKKYLATRAQNIERIINEYENDPAFAHFTHEDFGRIKCAYLWLVIADLVQIGRIDYAVEETIKSLNDDIIPKQMLFFTLGILYLCSDQFQESLDALEKFIVQLDQDKLENHETWLSTSRYVAMMVFMYMDQFDNALAMFKEIQSSAWYNSAPPDQTAAIKCFEKCFSNPPNLYKLVVEEKPQPKVSISEIDGKSSTVLLSLSFSGRMELDYEFAKQANINVDNLPKSIPIRCEEFCFAPLNIYHSKNGEHY